MRDALLLLSVFLACAVEGVEALTVVLAVGTTRSWRSTWYGVGAALLALAAIVGTLGPALTAIPIDALRLVVGALLLMVGLQWLRKAILRASGYLPLHDESAIFARQAEQARSAAGRPMGAITDWYSFTVAFKGVLLEGLEVALIVVSIGSKQGSMWLAVGGAVAAIAVVVAAGIAVRAPLARVPENTLKFAVGVMLTSVGAFWVAQGAGAHWPGGDAALVGIIVVVAVTAWILVAWLLSQAKDDKI